MKICKLLAVVYLSSLSYFATALDFSNIFFFGDSLTDLGNNTIACGGGACTNPPGYTWAHFLGQNFNLNITRSDDGGTDHAYSGAVTSGTPLVCLFSPSCTTLYQIKSFIQSNGGKLDSSALYSLWAGGNNILDAATPSPNIVTNVSKAATLAANDISKQVDLLHQAGAKSIIVLNLPDLSQTPAIKSGGLIFETIIRYFGVLNLNTQLKNKLNNKSFDIIQLDAFGMLNDILANPGLYGFNNVTSLCDPVTNPSCSGLLFVYNVHPTVAAHKIISDYVYSVLIAPSFYSSLSRMTSQNAMNGLFSVRQQMQPNLSTEPQTGTSFFGTLGVNPEERYEVTNLNKVKGTTVSGTIGVQTFINEVISLGLAFTQSYVDADVYQNKLGSFELTNRMVTVFGSYFKPQYYINGLISAGPTAYNDIHRFIVLGPYHTKSSGNTNGYTFTTAIEGGWFGWNNETKQFGPFAQLEYNRVQVQGYQEHGAPVGVNLAFNSQHENTLTGGIGVRGRWVKALSTSTLITNINLSANNQWLDETRTIGFHVASLTGSHASLPVTVPKGFFGQAGINIANIRSSGVIFSGGYQFSIGAHDYLAHVLNLSVSVPMSA